VVGDVGEVEGSCKWQIRGRKIEGVLSGETI
jgi:hypothetical protein